MSEEKSALLLDDNLMSSMRVQGQLEGAGYRVRTLRVLPPPDETAFDIVLINLGSRSMDGVGSIAPSKEGYPQSRVLGFCGHKEVEIRRAAKAAGVERIFTNEEAMMELAEELKRVESS